MRLVLAVRRLAATEENEEMECIEAQRFGHPL